MLNKVFAQNFVHRMKKTMNLKVNVMDERGVIIASASKERIGNFHLCAYEIIQNNLPILITKEPTKELIGVNAPGVNLRLTSGNETIGVIGVTGDPDQVTEIAKMVKLTFETMYEYEYKKASSRHGNNSIWNFAHILLKENPVNESSILHAARELNFSDSVPRIPIFMYLSSEYRSTVIQHFLDSCNTFSFHHHQDISLPADNGILLLKVFDKNSAEDFHLMISDTTASIQQEFLSREQTERNTLLYHFFVGPVQFSLFSCQNIYNDLLWLTHKVNLQSPEITYLTDYLAELTTDQLPSDFLSSLLSGYATLVYKNMDVNIFLETSQKLLEADMNLEHAARLLHLHKNSVIARLKKIRELLNINPVSSLHDAFLLQYICLFIQKDTHDHQIINN